MNKRISILFLIILAILLIVGCSTKQNEPPFDSEDSYLITSETKSEESESEIIVQTSEEERSFETIRNSDLPGDEKRLISFLEHLSWWTEEYDCQDNQIYYDFVLLMLSCHYTICDFELYSDVIAEAPIIDDYYHYNGTGLDWILSNIYNIDNEKLDEFKDELSQIKEERNEYGYLNPLLYKDGEYLATPGGIGGGAEIEIKEIQTNGQLYHIAYNVYWGSELETEVNREPGVTKYALMEYKSLNGKGYWTVYEVSEKSFISEETKNSENSTQLDWEEIYSPVIQETMDFIQNGFIDDKEYQYVPGGIMEEAGWMDKTDILNNIGYVIMDINGDDVPELLIGESNYADMNEQKDTIWGAYTYKNGEIVGFINAWIRNRFMWIGDGMFYHEGSGSATSGSIGFAQLDKNGLTLSWDEFYFFEDNKVYYNQSGEYDVSKSSLVDLDVDKLLQLQNQYTFERLSFKTINLIN